jgi:outer membrane protein assembly factor BamB
MGAEVGPSPAYRDGMVFAVNEFARLAAISLNSTPEMVWEYEEDLSEVASPVATQEYLFIASSYGPVSCFDTKTGERFWMHEFEEGFYSSPILVGDLIYLMDLEGTVQIFKADREFSLVGQGRLGEKVMTTPAYIDGKIYIRGTEHLFCIAKPNV